MFFSLSLLTLGGCQTTGKMADYAVGWIPWVHSDGASAPAPREKTVKSRGLALTMRLAPAPLKLSDARRMEVTLQLKNVSSRFIHLDFATAQRFDVVVRDAAGKTLVQWSEDRAFSEALGYIGINPGEHLEYQADFSTRDLQPGKQYVVTAFILNRDDLKVELPLVPEK